MKTPPSKTTRAMKRRITIIIGILLGTFGNGEVNGASYTWSGGSATQAGWIQGDNWIGGSIAFGTDTELIWHSEDANRLTSSTNALQANQTIRALTFNANAQGNISLRLTNGSGATQARTLSFESISGSATLTIHENANANITLGVAGPAADPAAVQIALVSDLNVTHSGSGTLTLNRGIGGSGALTKNGTGLMVLSGTNTYTGNTTINAGTLAAHSSTAFGTGAVHVQGNGIVSIASDNTLAGTSSTLGLGGTWQRHVDLGNSYSTGTTGTISSDLPSGIATTIHIAAATQATNDDTLTIQFTTTPDAPPVNDNIRKSDVAHLSMEEDSPIFVLELGLTSSLNSQDSLGWLNSENVWVHAIDGNSEMGANAILGFMGSFTNSGASASSEYLGSWGIDLSNNQVWAILDHTSEFAIVSIPEPSSFLLGALSLGLLYFRRKKSHLLIYFQR